MSSPPHVIIEGVYKNIPITILGEEHNNIDNSIYERMDLTDKIIMVEHSTILSELKKGEEKLFTCAKGLDWVWFTRTKNEQPVICIDNRLENGFYNSQEEIDIRSFIGNPNIHPLLFLEVTDRIMQSIRKIKEKFKPIEEVFKKLVRTTSTQIKKVIDLNKNDNERDFQNEENLIEREKMNLTSEHQEPWRNKKEWKLIHSIPQKFNRLVLFDGLKFTHGLAMNEDHYFNDYRLNQVMFFKKL